MAVNPLQLQEMQEMEAQRAEREAFQVKDVRSADWCLRKLVAIKAKRAEYETYVQEEIERLQEWLKVECEHLDNDAEYFTEHLTAWHSELLEQDPKRNKSVKLPHGTLKSRTTKPAPKKMREEDLLKHIKDAGLVEFIETKEVVKWGEYKKDLWMVEQEDGSLVVVDQTGQSVPGVEVDMGGTKFSVEVSE